MKFDLIISNPPYNKNLDLKILLSIKDLSDKICLVHPAGWLFDNKNASPIFRKVKNEIHLSNYQLIDGNKIFGINLFGLCSISYFNKFDNPLDYNKITHYQNKKDNEIFLSIRDKITKYSLTNNLRMYMNHPNNIKQTKEYFLKDNKKYSREFIVGFGNIRGNIGSADFYTFLQRDLNYHKGFETKDFYTIFYFENKEKQEYFITYLKSKFARFCLSINKTNQHINGSELEIIPWFDFSKFWTDRDCGKEIGITDEELKWIKEQIPDYYENK